MKIVKRIVSVVVVALGVWNVPAWAQTQQEELDYETDTLGIMADSLPELEMPTTQIPGDLIQARFAQLQKKIPLVYHPVSHQFVEYFIYRKPEFTRRMMAEKNIYFPIYEKALARHNMPDELKYLSMIESGLDPRIISYAGAGGLWQFMRATGREFGLRQDAYIDERFDPEKSTEAACRYLRQLYTIFGDWEMALASYNAGPGNVKRAMRRSGGSTFWSVYDALPKQTRSYVPQFVAILYMMHYGQDHGIVPQSIEYPTVADTVHVNGYLDLTVFASLSGVTMEEIRKFNPQIINTVLPDYTRNFVLKVPFQKFPLMHPERFAILDSASKKPVNAVMLASAGEQIGDYVYTTKRTKHTVRSGETLSSISNKYGVSIADVKSWNRMRSTKLLRGQKLTIVRKVRTATPRPIEAVASAKTTETSPTKPVLTEPVNEATSKTDGEEEIALADEEEEEADAPVAKPKTKKGQPLVHLVKKGETLAAISRTYGVTVDELKERNDLSNGTIFPGQKLEVAPAAVAASAKVAAANPAKKPIPQVKPRYHTVQQGDTLWTISQRYGLTIDKIKQANKIQGNSIKAGMKLLITG
ncbi:LysM peptidoglycan-binding domain-containing protein [Arundinibacter roseus]|uniref:LysM peptidoglycan-binding domain-containing protein n=1 Tax=Arundinibacter roseus TaxID=2070510 RepID=A0A4V6P8N8_9BACT|nr:LysM peptidoglycan-binding domain-containing protein [Arundinibacter roseus]TDB65805.1 LysM peptidoglycan-binding domain-containing protein [Arundinibacter roseus]